MNQRIAIWRSLWVWFAFLALMPCYALAGFSDIQNEEFIRRLETVSSEKGRKALALLSKAKAHHRRGEYALELKILTQGLFILNVNVTNKYKGEVLGTNLYRFDWQKLKEPLLAARLLIQAASAHENFPEQAFITAGALTQAIQALEVARGRTSFVDVSARLRIAEIARLVSDKLIEIIFMIDSHSPSPWLKQKAFFYAERSRSRLLLDLLWVSDMEYGGVARRHRDQVRAKFVLALVEEIERREQNLGRHSEVYRRAIVEAKRRLKIKSEREGRTDFDSYIRWGSKVKEGQRPSSNWDEVAGKLGFGEAMVIYHITEYSVFVFLIRRGADLYVDRISRTPDEITSLVMKLRAKLLDPRIKTWVPDAEQLYIKLIYPIQRYIRDVDRLIVVPHGILHLLPFAALVDPLDEVALLDRFTISYIPMSNMIFYRYESTKSRQSALILGIREFSTQPNLRYGEVEALAVKESLGAQAALLLGSEGTATKPHVLRELPNRKVLHFSTHGTFETENPLMSNLILKTDNGLDEPVFAFEILEHDIAAQFVVLSACETAITKPKAIALNDELFGLPWVFLITGAHNVIASLWAVDEKETSDLMRELYRVQSSSHASRIGTSLAKAMRARREGRHPYYWAPFVLIGLGR